MKARHFIFSFCFSTLSLHATAEDARCNVTQQSFNHIQARHCGPNAPGSRFIAQYCQSLQSANQFCALVQNSSIRNRVVQPDNRIRYDANLAQVVGMAGEKCGRLIIEPDGTVVTQFPEFNNAPGNCQ
ncbi:hypothetical protein OE749_16700 [Aestuariibacter sp. AA17]|uniref:Uncharacterized protein n=1 Tax=Fluctibacter corallii TaxID=2984329 RepID=A0ABT3ADM4_9ALTE|nr:hypothetical protein [Aestuariibacter sp. AA17]MCV2886336.1 hypothetical protein [Aestuariibacter sp. AA17]